MENPTKGIDDQSASEYAQWIKEERAKYEKFCVELAAKKNGGKIKQIIRQLLGGKKESHIDIAHGVAIEENGQIDKLAQENRESIKLKVQALKEQEQAAVNEYGKTINAQKGRLWSDVVAERKSFTQGMKGGAKGHELGCLDMIHKIALEENEKYDKDMKKIADRYAEEIKCVENEERGLTLSESVEREKKRRWGRKIEIISNAERFRQFLIDTIQREIDQIIAEPSSDQRGKVAGLNQEIEGLKKASIAQILTAYRTYLNDLLIARPDKSLA
jgi:hypothetical protein